MNILALDLSGNTGWACGAPRSTPVFGVLKLPGTGKDIGRYAEAFGDGLRTLVVEHEPGHVVFESPVMPSSTTLSTCRKLYGLAYHVELFCRVNGIGCSEMNNAKARKMFGVPGAKRSWTRLERRKFLKDHIIAQCRSRGWEPKNDDEADALCIWHAACLTFDQAQSALAV